MDRVITVVGLLLVVLGSGFLVLTQLYPELHQAYFFGGSLWLAVGIITAIVGKKKHDDRYNRLKSLK